MKSGNHRLELAFALSLLLVLSLISISTAVNICPVEKKPTEMSITHSQLPKNEPLGVFNNKIKFEILLEWMDKATGERGPLPGKNVTVTMMILDKYLKMRADGTFQLVSEESNFVLQTDTNGKIAREVVVDPFNPKKISYSITADFIPVTKDAYIGSTANAKYTPTSMPLFSLAACLPLVLVLGMLMAAMYVSGRNPLGALDLSRAAFRVPGVERRAVKQTIKAMGSGIAQGVGGKLGEIAGRQLTRVATSRLRILSGAALNVALKPKTIWAVGKGAAKTVYAVGKFIVKAPIEAYKNVTKEVPKVKKSTDAKQVQPAKKEATLQSKEQTAQMMKNLGLPTNEKLKAGQREQAAKERIQGTEAAGVLPVNLISLKFSVAKSGKELVDNLRNIGLGISEETAAARDELKQIYLVQIKDYFNRLFTGDLSVLGNLTAGERSTALGAKAGVQAKSMRELAEWIAKNNPWSTTEVPRVETARQKLDRKEISKWSFNIVMDEVNTQEKSRAGEHYDPSRNKVLSGGEIYSRSENVKRIKNEMEEAGTKCYDHINENTKNIGEKYGKEAIARLKEEIGEKRANKFISGSIEERKELAHISEINLKKVTDLVTGIYTNEERIKGILKGKGFSQDKIDNIVSETIVNKATAKQLIEKFPELAKDEKLVNGFVKETAKTLEAFEKFKGLLDKVIEMNNYFVNAKAEEKFVRDIYTAAKDFTKTSNKNPGKAYQQSKGTAVSPAEAIEWITTNENRKIYAKYTEAEREVGAVYAAVSLKKDEISLKHILEDNNLSPKVDVERVKEKSTKLLGEDINKYIDTGGSFNLIGINAGRISWTEQQGITPNGNPIMVEMNLSKADAEKFAKGLEKVKFTDYLDKDMKPKEMKLQDINEKMLGSMGISDKGIEKILGELKNEKSEIRANIANSLKIINDNAENYLGYDLGQLNGGKITARMQQKFNELGFDSKISENMREFVETGSSDSIRNVILALDPSLAEPDKLKEADKLVAETTAYVRMTKENGTLLAGFLESWMTGGERNAYEPMLEKLREGKIEEMGKALKGFVREKDITPEDFEKYAEKLTDFTPKGLGFRMIDNLRNLSLSAAEAGLDIPKMKLLTDSEKIAGAELPSVFEELLSNLNNGKMSPISAKIGAEGAMADRKIPAILSLVDGKPISSDEVQAYNTAAKLNYYAGAKLEEEIKQTVIATNNPKSKEPIESAYKVSKDNELKELTNNIADAAKDLKSGIEITRKEEIYTSKDNPLDKSVVEKKEMALVYYENVDQTSELFRRTANNDLASWKPDPKNESFVHKNSVNDGGYIDFKNEELAKQRLNALVISAMENKAPFENISNSEITLNGVNIKVDKDKLYITRKRTMIDKIFSKSSSDTSSSA